MEKESSLSSLVALGFAAKKLKIQFFSPFFVSSICLPNFHRFSGNRLSTFVNHSLVYFLEDFFSNFC
jgi:hypothetical protein